VLGEGEPLLAPAAARAHGAEACWLALAQPGPCAVAGTLDAALAHIRARGGVLDVVILDDAAQARVPRHADLLVLGRGDPGAAWLRESSEAVHRARWVVGLDAGEGTWLVRRRVGALRDLADGQRRDAGATRRVVMAGVGDPLSVARLASDAGVTVAAHIHVPDHGEPGPWARLRLRGRPALVTEKDALRWAAERPPSPGTLVLGVVLDGVDPLAVAVASAAA
jgi:tetraacyldisaccharide-1-P 4'-kinase